MELRTHGPLYMLDDALAALRAGGARLALRAVLGAAPLALCVLALDYFEQVEGVSTLRAPLCFAIVLAFLGRSVALSRVSRAYALLLRPSLPVVEPAPRAVQVASTAGLVGFGLLVWLALLLPFALAAPLALLALWPFTSLRGAVAPSWLARASCAPEHGRAAFGQAFDDTAGMRGVFAIVELMVQLGSLALLGNLFALVAALLSLGHSMFGLDVSFVSAFASPDNPWTLLVLGCVTLLFFEPLRAAVSAQAFVEARTRRDGADLHEAVDAAIASGGGRDRARSRGLEVAVALLLTLASCALPTRLHAQPDAQPDDTAVRARVAGILARDEFREHQASEDALSRWFARLGAWLETLELDERERKAPASDRGLSGSATAWAGIALIAVALAALAWHMRAQRGLSLSALGDLGLDGVGSRPGPNAAGAAMSAAHDDARAALRQLYLATLVALDRAGRLELDPTKTNGQHLHALPSGPSRHALAELTQLFDRSWYGRTPTTQGDLARGRALAARALDSDEPTAEPRSPAS